jgi:hypothetical protein
VSTEAAANDHELFWISGSPYAWRVQLALENKGVPYVSRRLNGGEGEHHTPITAAAEEILPLAYQRYIMIRPRRAMAPVYERKRPPARRGG